MAKKLEISIWFLVILFLKLSCSCQSRQSIITSIVPSTSAVSDDGEVIDSENLQFQPFIINDNNNNLVSSKMSSSDSSGDSCEQTYGFLPCTTTVLGNIFMILVYGYLMFMAAKLLSNGSEILLQILGPGIIGGLFLPVLSTVPDAAIILASGLSGSKTEAQSQVSVGMGLMAGSTVLLLTLLWGSSLIAAKSDIVASVAVDSTDTKTFSLTGSGISTDIWTSYAARIMIISVIPFIIVQLPQIFRSTSLSRIAILVSFIVSICLLFCYGLYQVFQPRIQKRRIAHAKHKRLMSGIMRQLKMRALGRLFTYNGRPNRERIQKLFETIDANSDGYLTTEELKAFVLGVEFEEINLDIDEAVEHVMRDFDMSRDSHIDLDEFIHGMSRWLNDAKHSTRKSHRIGPNEILADDFDQQTNSGKEKGGGGGHEGDDNENPKRKAIKAVVMVVVGTIVATVLADPLVDAVDNFSTASSIPSFFVSFVILPFATSSEVVTDLIFASRKTSKSSSLAYSEIYGSVTVGNLLSLAVFLGLVYFRGLTWDFSSEVLLIIIVCVVMGLIASFRTTFLLWMSFVAFALYPLSLLLAYVLDYVIGWD